MSADPTPLALVCGVGRSGTSLLQSLLNAHPEVCFTPETHFLRKYVLSPKARRRLEQGGARRFAELLSRDEHFDVAGLTGTQLLEPELSRGGALDLASVYRRFLSRYGQLRGKRIVGEKDPLLTDHLPEIRRLFPEAVVMHLVRDPRDVLLSRMKAEWSKGRPWLIHVMTYDAQFRLARTQGRRLFGDQFIELRYEDLVSSSRRALEPICAQLGVQFDSKMLDFSESARELVQAREMAWKQETLGPLLNKNTEKWRTELSGRRARVVEIVCRDALQSFRYRTDESLTRKAHPVAAFGAVLLRAIDPAAYWVWRRFAR